MYMIIMLSMILSQCIYTMEIESVRYIIECADGSIEVEKKLFDLLQSRSRVISECETLCQPAEDKNILYVRGLRKENIQHLKDCHIRQEHVSTTELAMLYQTFDYLEWTEESQSEAVKSLLQARMSTRTFLAQCCEDESFRSNILNVIPYHGVYDPIWQKLINIWIKPNELKQCWFKNSSVTIFNYPQHIRAFNDQYYVVAHPAEKAIYVYERENHQLKSHIICDSFIGAVALGESGSMVALSSTRGAQAYTSFWKNEQCMHVVRFGNSNHLGLSGNERYAAIGWDSKFLVFNLDNKNDEVQFNNGIIITALALNHDGSHVVAGSRKGITIWNVKKKESLNIFDFFNNPRARSLAVSSNGCIAVKTHEEKIAVIDLTSGFLIAQVESQGECDALAFSKADELMELIHNPGVRGRHINEPTNHYGFKCWNMKSLFEKLESYAQLAPEQLITIAARYAGLKEMKESYELSKRYCAVS